MMKTLVSRAGFKQILLESAQARASAGSAGELAAVPLEIAHIALEQHHVDAIVGTHLFPGSLHVRSLLSQWQATAATSPNKTNPRTSKTSTRT